MTERFEATTIVRRPRVLLQWLVAALLIATCAAASVIFLRNLPLIVGLFGLASVPIMGLIRRRPKSRSLRVVATREGVRVGAELVPRAEIAYAVIRHEGSRTFVRLDGARLIDVEVSGDEEGENFCHALGLDAKSAAIELAMVYEGKRLPFRAVIGIALGVAIALALVGLAIHVALAGIFAFVGFLGALFGVSLASTYLRTTSVRVGDDGVVLKRPFRPRAFVPHEDIASVIADGWFVVFNSKRDQHMAFRTPDAESIATRIDKALHLHRASAEASHATAALERGDKSPRAWIDHLRRIGRGANATFRDVAISREQLLELVESTSAAPIERLAAMVALREEMTDDERPRVRVATDRCAEPEMRGWMVRVASASDEELVAAFEEALSAEPDASDASRR